MKCPACFNQMSEMQVGSLVVDVCQGGCGGIWFDAFELQKVDDQGEVAGETLLEIRADPDVKVDLARKRSCPRCPDVKLHRHFFSPQRRVQVDECPNCGGYWLDAGELAQIRLEKAGTKERQESAGSSISAEVIRYLYRLEERRKHSQ